MEKSDFITKLYLDPIENVNLNKKTNKRYRLKEQSKEDSEVMHSLPNLQSNGSLMGSVIMQNWNTKSSIPHDIGGCLNFPIIIDRSKFKKLDSILCLQDKKKKLDFQKLRLKKPHLYPEHSGKPPDICFDVNLFFFPAIFFFHKKAISYRSKQHCQ